MGIMDFERNGFTLNWMDSFLLSWEGGGAEGEAAQGWKIKALLTDKIIASVRFGNKCDHFVGEL